jgi:hypothetical protein
LRAAAAETHCFLVAYLTGGCGWYLTVASQLLVLLLVRLVRWLRWRWQLGFLAPVVFSAAGIWSAAGAATQKKKTKQPRSHSPTYI